MSLLEWFFEPTNPGPVGNVEIDSPEEPDDQEPPRRWLIWLAIAIGLLLCGVGLWWVFYNLRYVSSGQIVLKLCWLTLYILASYKITARPDYSNVGWLGGLFDNPFRISDDYNRWLIYLQVLLLPGKLMAYSVVLTWFIGQQFYKKIKK